MQSLFHFSFFSHSPPLISWFIYSFPLSSLPTFFVLFILSSLLINPPFFLSFLPKPTLLLLLSFLVSPPLVFHWAGGETLTWWFRLFQAEDEETLQLFVWMRTRFLFTRLEFRWKPQASRLRWAERRQEVSHHPHLSLSSSCPPFTPAAASDHSYKLCWTSHQASLSLISSYLS